MIIRRAKEKDMKGINKLLCQVLMVHHNGRPDLFKSNDCYNVTLNVWSCNPSAMKFYEKCGLKPQKIGMEIIL